MLAWNNNGLKNDDDDDGTLKLSSSTNPPQPVIFYKYPHDCELCPLAVFHQYILTHTAMVGDLSADSHFTGNLMPQPLLHCTGTLGETDDDCCWYQYQCSIHIALEQCQLPRLTLLVFCYLRFCKLDNCLWSQPFSTFTAIRFVLILSAMNNLLMLS